MAELTEHYSSRGYRVGARVRLRYAARTREWFGLHLAEGVVVVAPGPGRGPRNHLVELDDGRRLVVPGGNLRELREVAP